MTLTKRHDLLPLITIPNLSESLHFNNDEAVLALTGNQKLQEYLRLYQNRCLSTNHLRAANLPNWKEVDAYLHTLLLYSDFRKRPDKAAKLQAHLEKICFDEPYKLMPHVSLFVLRTMRFFKSPEGQQFDVPRFGGLRDVLKTKIENATLDEMDKCKRAMQVLLFLVTRDEQAKRKLKMISK
ncbi:hypothetical protein F5Y18DRAFT_98845 [Xylariaceae sp. FL1019]|nr:hypothetical protein F5Y18DRAFT_98845 [Xylariaceae sp. FL1019]